MHIEMVFNNTVVPVRFKKGSFVIKAVEEKNVELELPIQNFIDKHGNVWMYEGIIGLTELPDWWQHIHQWSCKR